MSTDFTISFRDEGHLRAHLEHFLVPLDRALGWVREQLGSRAVREDWEHFDFVTPTVVGFTGLKKIRPWTPGDFWAPRKGRKIPSHLIVGSKLRTRHLCVWGFWEDRKTFILNTLYPGRVAPREIHDPEIDPMDLPVALRFWSRHAIIVSVGEWET